MSPGRKTRQPAGDRPPAASPPTAGTLPHLTAFLSAYLHEDFLLDHETPAAALQTFLAEASAAERRALADEWRLFDSATQGLAWSDVKQAFAALGGAWNPPTRAALLELFEALV